MTDYLNLALKYGGFTSLDKVYLSKKLDSLTEQQKLDFITPPPSVVNAYFSEIYQKQGAEKATDYFLRLSIELKLLQTCPSFAEEKPFIRLNLSGKSFGFAYTNAEGIAEVFSEIGEDITPQLLFEIAQIFPHYAVYEEQDKIFMREISFDDCPLLEKETDYLLTDIAVSSNLIKITGVNQEEILEAATDYTGQRFFKWSGRSAILYIKN